MILRKAKLDDFEVFKKLYEDEKGLYQFLYFTEHIPKPSNVKLPSLFFDKSILNLYKNYTIERFEKDLGSCTSYYMIEDDNTEIIGYISIFYSTQGKYRIAEWAMFNSDDDAKKVEILNCLKKLKLPRLKKFSICTSNKFVLIDILHN